MRKTALAIAGSDCSGGAGIQADIKTMLANGVYAMSAVTSLTAQNTMGVAQIADVREDFLAAQLDCIFTDIFPDAVKIGMMSSSGLINVTAEKLLEYNAKNIVVDTVMVSTSGTKLISDDAVGDLKEKLFPLAALITPNIPEAEILCGFGIHNEKDMERAAKYIGDMYNCAVLCKGGHGVNGANDLLYEDNTFRWYTGKRIDNPNTHGTGCTLSSAIASGLAKGCSIDMAISAAKEYVSAALGAMLDLGKGNGPLDHGVKIT